MKTNPLFGNNSNVIFTANMWPVLEQDYRKQTLCALTSIFRAHNFGTRKRKAAARRVDTRPPRRGGLVFAIF